MQRSRIHVTLSKWILVPILILSACSPTFPTSPPTPPITPIVPPTGATAEETATAPPNESQFHAKLAVVKFTAKVFKGGDTETEIQQDQQVDIQANDRIEVVKLEGQDEQSYSTLDFPEFLKVDLFSNVVLLLENVKKESGGSTDVTLKLTRGHMFVYLNGQTITQVTVETPYSTIKTLEDGTEFDVCHADALTCVLVKKGVAEVIGQGKKETLQAGEASYILKGEAPTAAICAPLEMFLVWEADFRKSASVPALGNVVSELPPEGCPPQDTVTPIPATAAPPPACRAVYVVRRGDTLYRIALRYGTTYMELARVNGIPNPRRIYPGQQLCIP
jgi:nucleoid-associated protein YgaU